MTGRHKPPLTATWLWPTRPWERTIELCSTTSITWPSHGSCKTPRAKQEHWVRWQRGRPVGDERGAPVINRPGGLFVQCLFLQLTWATSTVGEENMPRLYPTTSSTWVCRLACRIWRQRERSATTWATHTTAWDSTETLSGQGFKSKAGLQSYFCIEIHFHQLCKNNLPECSENILSA